MNNNENGLTQEVINNPELFKKWFESQQVQIEQDLLASPNCLGSEILSTGSDRCLYIVNCRHTNGIVMTPGVTHTKFSKRWVATANSRERLQDFLRANGVEPKNAVDYSALKAARAAELETANALSRRLRNLA